MLIFFEYLHKLLTPQIRSKFAVNSLSILFSRNLRTWGKNDFPKTSLLDTLKF